MHRKRHRENEPGLIIVARDGAQAGIIEYIGLGKWELVLEQLAPKATGFATVVEAGAGSYQTECHGV